MALLKRKNNKPIEDFISTIDSAIDEEKTDLEAYREAWDQSKLVFKEGQKPTLLKIRMDLPRKLSTEIKNASIGSDKKGRAKFALGDHENEVVRSVLVGIEHPEGFDPAEVVIWKKGNDGCTAEEVMDDLTRAGVAEEIYAFYHHMKKGTGEELKKSSKPS